ncbi:MAG: hypothetical protein U9Q66_00640 [Patescibacteria group bacterium]|nr:hypothetical protein [Patescibacteria group bacterium]
MLSENDIENSKKIFTEKLKKKALEKVKNQLKEENKINNVSYEIL